LDGLEVSKGEVEGNGSRFVMHAGEIGLICSVNIYLISDEKLEVQYFFSQRDFEYSRFSRQIIDSIVTYSHLSRLVGMAVGVSYKVQLILPESGMLPRL
jgi:hypothetical protein